MNYIGSKKKLLPFLEESMLPIIKENNYSTFCDLFAGTGIVGTFFKSKGLSDISNDLQFYSYALNRHYVGNCKPLSFDGLKTLIPALEDANFFNKAEDIVCTYLNNIEPVEGFIYNNYSKGNRSDNEEIRLFFTEYNAGKCDAVRQTIQIWLEQGLITEDEFFFLLTCLLESIDSVRNTTSVYCAYLKKFQKTAMRKVVIKPVPLIESDNSCLVYNKDANELIADIDVDVLYLDPPYNHRQYSGNYHLLETIARYDNPTISGKAGLRTDCVKSDYSSKRNAKQALTELISNAKAKVIFMSYNNEGILSLEDIEKVFSSRGEYSVFTKKYQRYKADKDSEKRVYKDDKVTEYLHCVKCL